MYLWSGAGEVSPEVLQQIRDIANSHENLQCVECANQIEQYLKQKNIYGRRIELDTPKPRTAYDNYIYDDSLPTGSDAISGNGHHEGIATMVDGEEKV